MKVEIKNKAKGKEIEAGELQNGLYAAKWTGDGTDRILVVADSYIKGDVYSIGNPGGTCYTPRDAIFKTYTDIRKIKKIKIEYELEG